MLIERERSGDHEAIRTVLAEAFRDQTPAGNEPVEVALVDTLRKSSEWIPALALVARADGDDVVGFVVCTRGSVDGEPALGLGPLAVTPRLQGRGTGAALMHAVLGAADALEEPLVVLLGHTEYYPRFGFQPAAELGVVPEVADWASHFQVRTLSAYGPELCGTFRYAPAFGDV